MEVARKVASTVQAGSLAPSREYASWSSNNLSATVAAYTLTSAMGTGLAAMRERFARGSGGLSTAPWPYCDVPCALGRVADVESVEVPARRLSRNNQLVSLALAQDGFTEAVRASLARFGSQRVGMVMGTSTSSIDRTEAGYRHRDDDGRFPIDFQQPDTHHPHAPGAFSAELLGIEGPSLTISAACASSAKVFATANRWLQQKLVDAVVVGGVDTLCLSVIYGFHSLQLVAPEPCRPFAVDRQGISLGEAAGFALLTRDDAASIRLCGVGESCDAHHMSSAHPEGLGARLAMLAALEDAGMTMAEIDYLNLHGTGTKANDATEGMVCADLLEPHTLVSATKGWTGHTLGAAGIVEAILCIEAIARGFVPGTCNTREHQAEFDLLLDSHSTNVKTAMTNSFGFGGNNCSLVFGSC